MSTAFIVELAHRNLYCLPLPLITISRNPLNMTLFIIVHIVSNKILTLVFAVSFGWKAIQTYKILFSSSCKIFSSVNRVIARPWDLTTIFLSFFPCLRNRIATNYLKRLKRHYKGLYRQFFQTITLISFSLWGYLLVYYVLVKSPHLKPGAAGEQSRFKQSDNHASMIRYFQRYYRSYRSISTST